MEFKEKFIGFVDILGFKQLVDSAENETGMSLSNLLKLVGLLGVSDDNFKAKPPAMLGA